MDDEIAARNQWRAGIRAEIENRMQQFDQGVEDIRELDSNEARSRLLTAAVDVFEDKYEKLKTEAENKIQDLQDDFDTRISGYVSSSSVANFAAMVPIIGVSTLFLFAIYDGWGGGDATLYLIAGILGLIVAGVLAIITWPTLLPNRSERARYAVAIGFFLLNAFALGGAAVGIGEVVTGDGNDDDGSGDGSATEEATEPDATAEADRNWVVD